MPYTTGHIFSSSFDQVYGSDASHSQYHYYEAPTGPEAWQQTLIGESLQSRNGVHNMSNMDDLYSPNNEFDHQIGKWCISSIHCME